MMKSWSSAALANGLLLQTRSMWLMLLPDLLTGQDRGILAHLKGVAAQGKRVEEE